MKDLFLIILLLAFAFMLIGSDLYSATRGKVFKRLYHDKLLWHIPQEARGFDGCSMHSICKICKKEIMQDSQGNWF